MIEKVNNHTIDDAYVQFILFCNPSIALDTDTAELRRGFRAPPKSDGKAFSPYDLFTLIAKLEDKKDGIDNWTKLVLELGVEPPDMGNGQSSQKVQQYAVRLKVIPHSYFLSALIYIFHCSLSVHQSNQCPSAGYMLSTWTRFMAILLAGPLLTS